MCVFPLEVKNALGLERDINMANIQVIKLMALFSVLFILLTLLPFLSLAIYLSEHNSSLTPYNLLFSFHPNIQPLSYTVSPRE